MIESLDKGIAFHTSGQLDKAKKIYESIIQSDANNFEAIHLLGVIFFQKKKLL
jgi:tetratricopeptide (TPR) repeat protein